MSRQPHEIANINLRIRETLRAKLEREAKRHRFSLNNEIRLRLEDSFTRAATRTLDDIADGIEMSWSRYGNRLLCLRLEEQLASALAQTKDPEVANLARSWLIQRERDRRLTEGGVS
jgi:7-keto-8-aminopelargonate synthetase-like enzyme